MYRALSASRQVTATSNRQCVRVVLSFRSITVSSQIRPTQRLTAEATPQPKKKSAFRRIVITTAAVTGSFYVGSTFLSFHNQAYYDLFSEYVPLAQTMLEFGEGHGWDTLTLEDISKAGTNVVITTYDFVRETVNGFTNSSETTEKGQAQVTQKTPVPRATQSKTVDSAPQEVKPAIKLVKQVTSKLEPAEKKGAIKEDVNNGLKKVQDTTEAAEKDVANKVRYEHDELVRRAEAAIAGRSYDKIASSSVEATPDKEPSHNVYDRPLPIGFEPPPGFSRSSPPETKPIEEMPAEPDPAPVELPSIAPVVATAQEPIIIHLATTIDNLTSFLKFDPKAAQKVGDVLETAKHDLAALVDRIDAVKEQERNALESKLDEQTREYTLKLMELEMEAQDKLDSQEEGFKQFFEQERAKLVQAYREKLENELKVQTELINERLKEEVIAQGVELQRRWIRDIKVRVEQERGGRLAKLDEVSANLKRLEGIALANSAHLDENLRIHSLWSAIRALSTSTIFSSVRKPFRDELRVLRHMTAAREDPVVSAALDSLESTDIPDVGVEPFADLATWFVNDVCPKVSQVALVPDQNAGVLSYIASRALSSLRFRRQGLVPGNDVLSVLARAEYYLNEKNLDFAARELNQLKGPAKELLRDWLEAARRRLEVQQALEAVQTEATHASLLVI